MDDLVVYRNVATAAGFSDLQVLLLETPTLLKGFYMSLKTNLVFYARHLQDSTYTEQLLAFNLVGGALQQWSKGKG